MKNILIFMLPFCVYLSVGASAGTPNLAASNSYEESLQLGDGAAAQAGDKSDGFLKKWSTKVLSWFKKEPKCDKAKEKFLAGPNAEDSKRILDTFAKSALTNQKSMILNSEHFRAERAECKKAFLKDRCLARVAESIKELEGCLVTPKVPVPLPPKVLAPPEPVGPSSPQAEKEKPEPAIAKLRQFGVINIAHINNLDDFGLTPLMRAIRNSKDITPLLEAGADINATSKAHFLGFTPLITAVHFKNAEALSLLIKSRAELDGADSKGRTPLFVAVEEGNTEAMQQLLEAGAKVNIGDKFGKTPLMIAAQNSNIKAVELLINNTQEKADINAEDTFGDTALKMARDQGIKEILEKAMKGPDVP